MILVCRPEFYTVLRQLFGIINEILLETIEEYKNTWSLGADPGSNRRGRLSQAPPISLRSEASDALDDFLLDAWDPLRTWSSALSFPPQPWPGDHFVLSSSSCEGLLFFLLCKDKYIINQKSLSIMLVIDYIWVQYSTNLTWRILSTNAVSIVLLCPLSSISSLKKLSLTLSSWGTAS